MKVTVFYNKTVHENASYYYQLAKEAREKVAGAEKALAETEKEITEAKKPEKSEVKVKRAKEWHEKFRSAFTSGGQLMIGGRDAKQNDMVYAKHLDDDDLFFHADIQGASALILKGGVKAGEQDLKEAAQFSASHSNAWKNANASVDVYSVKKGQVSKHAQGGFIPSGAFAITGQRTWYRSTKLALLIGKGEKGVELIPECSKRPLAEALILVPSQAGKEKGQLAKSLGKRFGVHPDELLSILPNGKSKTVER
ncbi:MAG: NFACT RNA binding domain-containing protein [Candidatus Micrarchaeota archaeon]